MSSQQKASEATPDQGVWPVMVLAHNEERFIVECLDSLFSGNHSSKLVVYVIANGCTDRTVEIVNEYGRSNADVRCVNLELADKCNAWNHFIHETVPQCCPGAGVYYFVDGDARVSAGALSALMAGLERNPHAHAASAVPGSGRNARRDSDEIVAERGLVANLYALRGDFVERLRQDEVRIPLGLEGDDGLIGALVKWDLCPDRNEFDHQRVEPCSDAEFLFESMSWSRPSDWRVYLKRRVRYGRRHFEFRLLGERLKTRGLGGLPIHIDELYPAAKGLRPRGGALRYLFDSLALREMENRSTESN